VPFYGPNPPLEDVPRIRAAVLAIYGELDSRINAGIPAIREAMQRAGVTFEIHIYPGADHAFFNDTGPRYRPEAAEDAWRRTLAWFDRYLKG
jgi:carboxymethylenebutenolidase